MYSIPFFYKCNPVFSGVTQTSFPIITLPPIKTAYLARYQIIPKIPSNRQPRKSKPGEAIAHRIIIVGLFEGLKLDRTVEAEVEFG